MPSSVGHMFSIGLHYRENMKKNLIVWTGKA